MAGFHAHEVSVNRETAGRIALQIAQNRLLLLAVQLQRQDVAVEGLGFQGFLQLTGLQ